MRNAIRAGLLAAMCLGLADCVLLPPEATPAQKLVLLPTGEPLLSCREACVWSWRGWAPTAAALEREGRWRELAWLVLRVDYQDDLTLYYLGRAARGLGYPAAAASYFRQSLALSGTSASCYYMSRTCGGVDLPGAALVQLAEVDRELRPRRHRRRPARIERRHEPAQEAPPREVHETEPAPAVGMPPPPHLPGAPPPAAAPVPPGGGEFIEPPPAR